MATLTVENVGPIRKAELDIKKHTVFIGPQGSGKSTLAKLIAIGGDGRSRILNREIFAEFNVQEYIKADSEVHFVSQRFKADLVNYEFTKSDAVSGLDQVLSSGFPSSESKARPDAILDISTQMYEYGRNRGLSEEEVFQIFLELLLKLNGSSGESCYVPSERNIFPVLSDSIWSLLTSKTNLPEMITGFGNFFEKARNQHDQLHVPFLKITYQRTNGQDLVEFNPGQTVQLAQSASGYQSIIPLLLVVEHQRRNSKRRFIIEEPELNLYPTAQKDLIYNLISGLDPAVTYQDAEWVFTTHSPYILSSFNTLMLAWKVAQRSPELRAEVAKIVPARCWINPDEFAAYYVDKGTVRSIVLQGTGLTEGLIDDNELDDASLRFAAEQEQLLDLYRSTVHA